MARLQKTLLTFAYSSLAFFVAGFATYSVLWHYAGMDKITPEDNPAAVLGVFWCFQWGLTAGIMAGFLVGLGMVIRARQVSRKQAVSIWKPEIRRTTT
jgi:hypothetical protein